MRNFKQQMAATVLSFWQQRQLLNWVLWPLSLLFSSIAKIRAACLKKNQASLPVPIIIVGNITVGGTGKTPLVIHISQQLIASGYRPGIVLRGYKSQLRSNEIQVITHHAQVNAHVGDEALLLARHTQCPIAVGAARVEAITQLLQQCPEVNIIISDDGLQHYHMPRSVEIAVIDGEKRLGNGFCLPAGPLRESATRLQTVDFIVTNNGVAQPHEWAMESRLAPIAIHIQTQKVRALSDFKLEHVVAMAGIGRPDKFFSMLKPHCASIQCAAFPDHHEFKQSDLNAFEQQIILMTEKDAVKCQAFAPANAWFIPLEVSLPEEFNQALVRSIERGQKTIRNTRLPDLQEGTDLQEG